MSIETLKTSYVSQHNWDGLQSKLPFSRMKSLAPPSQISGTFSLNVGRIKTNEGRRHYEEKFCYPYNEKPKIKLFPQLKNLTIDQIHGANSQIKKVCIPPKRKLVHEKFFKHNKIDDTKPLKYSMRKKKVPEEYREDYELVKNLDLWKEKKLKSFMNL